MDELSVTMVAEGWRWRAHKRVPEEGKGVEGEVRERAWVISLEQTGEEEKRRAGIEMLVVMGLIRCSESCGKQEVPWGAVVR